VCSVHHGAEDEPLRLDREVALAAVDLLPAVEAPHAADAADLDRLAVENRGAGLRVAAGTDTDALAEGGVHPHTPDRAYLRPCLACYSIGNAP
jgi:hypothetical protein